MTATLPIIAAGALTLSDAMAAWWGRIKPSEAAALAWWASELQQTGADALAEGDQRRAQRAARALAMLQGADAVYRRRAAELAALAIYQAATRALVSAFSTGALQSRILDDGREFALLPEFWLCTEFCTACWHRPAIYLSQPEFEAWLAAQSEPKRVHFSDLKAFLAERIADNTSRPPSESADWEAAKIRFGAHVSRQEIRGARAAAYSSQLPKRGRPTRSAP